MRFKPVCSATGTRKFKIYFVARFDMVLTKERITKVLIRLRGCAGWSVPLLFTYLKEGFLTTGPFNL